ncbi:hypothetical protein ACIP88_25555 [Streptomyces uncialis]
MTERTTPVEALLVVDVQVSLAVRAPRAEVPAPRPAARIRRAGR